VDADERVALLLFDLEVATRPAIERHEGPPVHVEDHASGFYEQYADDPAVYGPFIDGDRYVVEREREIVDAEAFLDSEAVLDVKHGAAVAEALEGDYTVYRDEALEAVLLSFGEALGRYFDPRP
jgi:tRNA nucleotidyltransferase (CCA-adding enzyme)